MLHAWRAGGRRLAAVGAVHLLRSVPLFGATAWVRSWFALPGILLGPALVGVLGEPHSGSVGSIGDAVTALAVPLVPAAAVLWWLVPEPIGGCSFRVLFSGCSGE